MENDEEERKHIVKLSTLFYAQDYGRFQRVGEYRDLIPKFKDFYYKRKMETTAKYSSMKIVSEFQETIKPLIFCPYPNQYRMWRKKWDVEIMANFSFRRETAKTEKALRIENKKNLKENNNVDMDGLEGGVNTLADSLLSDATGMLSGDQDMENLLSSDELIKRRNYILNVMRHVTRLVQGKEALKLKSNANQRENAGFLMNILNQATSGKLTTEALNVLKGSVIKKPNEEVIDVKS